jgi:hypothetical protein
MSRAGNWWWTPVAGALFGIGAIAASPVTGLGTSGAGLLQDEAGWLAPFLGTFITACLFWGLIIGWPRRLSPARGAFTGALVGLCSTPVVLAIADLRQGKPVDVATLGERSFGIIELAALTILTTGFAVMVIMAGVGVLVALLLRRPYPPAPTFQPVPWMLKAGAIALAAVVLLLGGAFAWLSQLPLNPEDLTENRPTGEPTATYETAMAAFAKIEAEEAALPLNPDCTSRLFTHGAMVAKVVVYLHGLTNCPLQADELAGQLFALGYNVYVPRWPGHGEADQMTLALVDLSAEQMVASTYAAIDLAHGLGDEVIVTGMSAGGAMTAWAAQYRADVAHTVAVSPFLGPHFVPPWANGAAANLLLKMPNMMLLWNPLEPEGSPGMKHSYPRIPTHALAQFMRLGTVLEAAATQSPPRAAGLGMLLNDADFAVNNALARQLIAAWQARGRQVDVEVLPRTDLLPHDLIDPRMPGARTELVYPVLIEMLSRGQD